jgi:hypothetical protein
VSGPDLSDAQLERLADLLAPRIADALRGASAAELIDAAEVARRFGVSAEWARDHRAELGAIRLGDGPRPRLRFDPKEVAAVLRRRSESVRSPDVDLPAPAGERSPATRKRADNDLDALPVRRIKPLSSADTKAARRCANTPGPATRATASTRQQPISAAADRPSPRRTIRKERA